MNSSRGKSDFRGSRANKILPLALTTFVSFAFCQSLHAQVNTSEQLNLAGLAATCASCHGTNGHGASPPVLVTLNGLTAEYMTEQLLAYRSGSRAGTIMPKIVKGYSEDQLKDIARYLGKK